MQQPAQPSVEYPLNTAELDQDEQALQQVLQSAKSQRVPTMTQLVDLVAINELLGTVESSGDGKNANLVAQLETESLAAKAAEFKNHQQRRHHRMDSHPEHQRGLSGCL